MIFTDTPDNKNMAVSCKKGTAIHYRDAGRHGKIYRTWIILLLIVSICVCLVWLPSCSTATTASGSDTTTSLSESTPGSNISDMSQTDPLDTFMIYSQVWSNLDFSAMYRLFSSDAKGRIDETTFIDRMGNITRGIEAENILADASQDAVSLSEDGRSAVIPFTVNMDTLAGHLEIVDYVMNLVLEETDTQPAWKVDWTEQLIFPQMEPGDKVRARILAPERGAIRDRNGQGLAINGELIVIGVVPGKFDKVREEAIPQMAEILGISTDQIEKSLTDATHSDWFYPVVTLPSGAGDMSAKLTAIDGVQYQKVTGRIYPAGPAAGLVIGYIGAITAEELEKLPKGTYSANDKIGKMGLEQVYEDRLRGRAGGEIYLAAEESTQVKEMIAYLAPIDGEDIQLALDSKVQYELYDQMKNDAGAAAAVDPRTGEILALVSTPSFDPNYLQTYIPNAIRQSWNNAAVSPFTNRFKVGYAPGSVFKLVTASIGLKSGTLDPDEALPISGLTWQPDASWGNYRITRVKDIGVPVNLQKALIYSDNIYFARQALRVGWEKFTEGAAGFGIGETLPIDYPFYPSQIANNTLENPVLLADTGYGQGEILLSPLHIALFYSALATNGDIMAPILEMHGTPQASVWKSQAIDSSDVPLLTDILVQVVENPAGTAYTQLPAETRMLGKTGTAELKSSLSDEQSEENGWFVAMNINQPRLTIAMVVLNVKDRGGSHYVVPLVKQAMDDLMPLLPSE